MRKQKNLDGNESSFADGTCDSFACVRVSHGFLGNKSKWQNEWDDVLYRYGILVAERKLKIKEERSTSWQWWAGLSDPSAPQNWIEVQKVKNIISLTFHLALFICVAFLRKIMSKEHLLPTIPYFGKKDEYDLSSPSSPLPSTSDGGPKTVLSSACSKQSELLLSVSWNHLGTSKTKTSRSSKQILSTRSSYNNCC